MNPPENFEYPQWLWQFVDQVLGAETVHYLDETQCCGTGLRERDPDTALALTRRKIRQMEEMGANSTFFSVGLNRLCAPLVTHIPYTKLRAISGVD